MKSKRTAAVETFPYYALGHKDSSNSVVFIFDNGMMVDIDLGKNHRNRRPKVSARDRDTGVVILQATRMDVLELARFLVSTGRKLNFAKG